MAVINKPILVLVEHLPTTLRGHGSTSEHRRHSIYLNGVYIRTLKEMMHPDFIPRQYYMEVVLEAVAVYERALNVFHTKAKAKSHF